MNARNRALFGGALLAGLTLGVVAIARDAGAGCGPTFCPSYTTCRVAPVAKPNPTFTELSDLFDKIAPGPSVYGSLGWTYSLTLNDGAGKPHPATKTPARYPCVLLKAISVQESVAWHQFCVPTGPTCTGVSQTIIAFDCGYGLMQVTSGMRTGETSAYDANLVASDPAYNVSVGSQILGQKWAATPSVGDNRLDVIEDWYIATWAYNGLAFKNNPNNPAYPADRKPYRDPGGLSGGNYPYQELIWGYVRVPYGLKETGTAGYKGFPLSYPKKSEICASCGSPSAAISDPSPLNVTDCPGGATPPSGALFEVHASTDAKDRFDDGVSKGVGDAFEGDAAITVDLTVSNSGGAATSALTLGVDVGDPYLTIAHYEIQSDNGTPGTFKVNDADARPDNPPHDAPGKSLSFNMNALSPKETKRLHLTVNSPLYSMGAVTPHPQLRVWVKDAPGIYTKASWDAAPTNVGGAQKFNGGDLRAALDLDVYSHVRWSFDGQVLEGFAPSGAASLAAKSDQTLLITCTGDDPQAIGPDTSFSAEAYGAVKVRAKTPFATPARLYFATTDAPGFAEARAVDVDIPADGAFHDVIVDLHAHPSWKGTITKLRLDPVSTGNGDFVLDDLRATTPSGGPPDAGVDGGVSFEANGDASGGCSCRMTDTPGDETTATFAGFAIAGLMFLRRRRVR